MRPWKHCRRLLAPAAMAASLLVVATSTGGEIPVRPLAPGAATIVTHGSLAFLIHAPAEGTAPIVVAVFSWGGDVVPPPVPPVPRKVTGVWIVEEVNARTAKQSAVLDDPVWQAAAIAKGLKYHIEDKDHPSVAHLPRDKVPVVCLVDGDGKVVEVVPLPATAEEMRGLIGGLKWEEIPR